MAASRGGGDKRGMEVEVKLRLGSKDDYDRLALALAAGAGPVYQQENVFFDGPGAELNSKRVVVRVRLYNKDQKATLTVKVRAAWHPPADDLNTRQLTQQGLANPLISHLSLTHPSLTSHLSLTHLSRQKNDKWQGEQILKDGIGRAAETEEPLAPADARRFISEPSALLAHDSAIVRQLARWAAVERAVAGDFHRVYYWLWWWLGHAAALKPAWIAY